MLEKGFLVASANITNMDPEAQDIPILTARQDMDVTRIMSNSFGFGGTNSTLIIEKYVP
jgi:3-oxoacyl-[acyl-carrier-protein] synthase-1